MGKARFLIITGMSGAGKSLVLKVMEDLDYFCIDNLPPTLIPKFAELYRQTADWSKNIALVVDIRVGSFFSEFTKVLEQLRCSDVPYEMLFLDCDDEVLVRRYKETRRRHPLSTEGRISHGIYLERQALAVVREFATNIIDTSNMSNADLRQEIVSLFGPESQENPLSVTVLSFGFKHGIPTDADMVFDVRFLPNPFYVEELKYKSGNTAEVAEYIYKWPVTRKFLEKLEDMVDFLMPQFAKEGKQETAIAIGCTGGMHRSVFIVNRLSDMLKMRGYKVRTEHRDIPKNRVKE